MRKATFEDSLEAFFDYKSATMYTALNCRVVAVKTELHEQRIDVQPLPNAVKPDGEDKQRPVITNVPVMFPSSKKASLTFPIDVGDTVLCVFSQRSLDQFKASTNPKPYKPNDTRRFSIRDAIAIPGLFSFSDAINNPAKHTWTHSTRDLVIVNNLGTGQENEVRLKEGGDIEVKTNQDFYATFNNGLIECNNLQIDCANDMTLNIGNNMTMSVGSVTDITTTTLNVTVGGSTEVSSPTTNWTGTFNLAGTFSQSGGGSGGATATFDSPMTINAPITSNSDITTSAEVTASGVALSSHTHTGDSGGTTSPPN